MKSESDFIVVEDEQYKPKTTTTLSSTATMTSTSSSYKEREIWSSRSAFILAAVGSSVGFGNVWRFPALVYHYGGGAFFLPYLSALLLVGLPLLIQEVCMGQHLRTGDVGVSGHFSKHLRGVGVASILSGLMVATYYVPLISWCIRAFVESFGTMKDDWKGMSGTEATNYFFHNLIGTYTLDESRRPTRIVPLNVVYLAFTWILVGGCLAFGVKWTGRIAYFTMGLPVVMLFVLLIRALTLPGASNGIHAYIGDWDMSVLFESPDIWSTAVSQIFFSMGVAFGVMSAFGSRCKQNDRAVENSCIIAASNSAFSILSGLCLFAILGYLSTYEGDFRVYSGPAFLFGAYPAALSTITGGLHWVRLLFFNLILLGLDSAFALVEAITTVVEDSKYVDPESPTSLLFARRVIVVSICVVGFLGGLLYTTDAGLIFLDTIDFYVNFAVLFLGFCKAISAGWIYGMGDQMDKLGYNIVYGYFGTTFGSLLFTSLVWFGVKGDTAILGFVCFFVIYGCGVAYCHYNMKGLVNEERGITMETLRAELLMGNVLRLRQELSTSVGYVPWIWAFLMKHFIPQILLVLFFNLFFSKTYHDRIEFGNYGDYQTWPFQVVGMLSAILIFVTVFAGIANSKVFAGFVRYADDREEWVDVMDDVEMTRDATQAATRGSEPGQVGAGGGDYKNMDMLDTARSLSNIIEGVGTEDTFHENEKAVMI